MKSTRIILGVDPGLADIGYGIIKQEHSSLTCMAWDNIKTPKNLNTETRLSLLHDALAKIIITYKPNIAGVEKLFFSKNVTTGISVGQARGVIFLTLKEANIPIQEFTPLQVKQSLTTYGRATKHQVQQMVKVILGMKQIPKPDDAADALAVAICCAHHRII